MPDPFSTFSDAADELRAAAIEKQPVIGVPTDGVFHSMTLLADATRAALAAKADNDGSAMALNYGRIDGILAALQSLRIPVPHRTADELLTHAEALMGLDDEALTAKLAEVEGAARTAFEQGT